MSGNLALSCLLLSVPLWAQDRAPYEIEQAIQEAELFRDLAELGALPRNSLPEAGLALAEARDLREMRIPYFAFRSYVPGKSTGAHIHLGPPSKRP